MMRSIVPLAACFLISCGWRNAPVELPQADGGGMAMVDSGPRPDAGADLDAEVAPDGGRRVDTGVVLDGGFDAGTTPDAGPLPADAAVVDAAVPEPAPLQGLSPTLYINFGDSFGAGYNADRNRGYAPLLCGNHAAYPMWAAEHLQARFSGLQCVNRASSGDTSDDMGGQTRNLPDPGQGDTIATIYIGGNDFNNDIRTMISAVATRAAIANWERNLGAAVDRLQARYEDPASGRRLIVMLATIHDPTDGTGAIPPTFKMAFARLSIIRCSPPDFAPWLQRISARSTTLFGHLRCNAACLSLTAINSCSVTA